MAETKRHVIEGVGVAIVGHEVNYIALDPTLGGRLAASDLFEACGAELVDESVATAMEYAGRTDFYGEYWRPRVDAYRTKTGRAHPRVYRLRITVECEELPDAEAEAWWVRHRVAPGEAGNGDV